MALNNNNNTPALKDIINNGQIIELTHLHNAGKEQFFNLIRDPTREDNVYNAFKLLIAQQYHISNLLADQAENAAVELTKLTSYGVETESIMLNKDSKYFHAAEEKMNTEEFKKNRNENKLDGMLEKARADAAKARRNIRNNQNKLQKALADVYWLEIVLERKIQTAQKKENLDKEKRALDRQIAILQAAKRSLTADDGDYISVPVLPSAKRARALIPAPTATLNFNMNALTLRDRDRDNIDSDEEWDPNDKGDEEEDESDDD